jgi:hypothetical protein
MDTSLYQQFKIYVGEFVPLDRDHWHILIGAIIVIVYLLVPRWRNSHRGTMLMLAVALILGVLMELIDLLDDYRSLGYARWFESAGDLFLTISLPVVYFVARNMVLKRRRN